MTEGSPRTRIVACQTVADVLRRLAPARCDLTVLEFGLHLNPEKLHDALQQEIDRTDGSVDAILLGYGMCSKGTLDLQARGARLVIPRCDDCISLFLGSRAEYARQREIALGTFYLSRGWIDHGGDPYSEYRNLVARYGEERAMRLEKLVMQNYTRVALIDMGDLESRHRAYARHMADFFGWALNEIPGSPALLHGLLEGRWTDTEFVVIEPGGKVELGMFLGTPS